LAIPYLILTDADSNTYDFNQNFIITSKTVNTSVQILENAYASGGKNIADKFPRSTVITVAGGIYKDTPANFETAKRAMMQALLKGGQLSLSGDPVDRYYDVIFAGITQTGKRSSKHIDQVNEEYNIKFRLECPFWKDATEDVDDNILTGDDTVSISNDGDYIVKPVITVDADQSVDIPSFTITNTTDGSMSFTYTDSNFLSGSCVEIDCAQSLITRDGGDSSEYFTGNFLRLLTGTNSIDYEGAACTLTFTFRKVYL
jgi:phage-related protein